MALSIVEQNTNITTATTTPILAAGGASVEQRIKAGMISVCNKDADTDVTITLQKNDGTNTYVIAKGLIPFGDSWVNDADIAILGASMVLQLVTSAAADVDVCVTAIKNG